MLQKLQLSNLIKLGSFLNANSTRVNIFWYLDVVKSGCASSHKNSHYTSNSAQLGLNIYAYFCLCKHFHF